MSADFRAVSRAPVGSKREKRPELWQFSKNLLWQPLHKDLSPHLQGATSMFTAILNYSGDRSFSGQIPHTRTIFDPPLVQVSGFSLLLVIY